MPTRFPQARAGEEPTTLVAGRFGAPMPPAFTAVVAVFVVAATGYGLLADGAYGSVQPLVEQTWRAQDAVTLAVVPLLVWAGRRARAGSLHGHLLWLGLVMWLAYCYAHLSFGSPFNVMFLAYVALLGLAGFGLLDGLVRLDLDALDRTFARVPRRPAAWFLLVAGLGIATLWLSDVVVGLAGGTPANLHLAGLPNPTWVLDLAWLIPMSIGAAVMLRRRHPAGPAVAAVLLVMLLVLSVAMLAVTPFAVSAGLADDPSVMSQLVVFSVLFALLAIAEGWLLFAGTRRTGEVSTSWLRTGWWARGM
ncbi:MAG TPA: hypothetical protein VFR74_13365 [Jiangellales bacterium]|nr:hypothetical protein [Jiangellales bacterium]